MGFRNSVPVGLKQLMAVSALLLLAACGVNKSLRDRPDIGRYQSEIPDRVVLDDSTFTIGRNFLRKNNQGQWELYINGDPLEIGLKNGSLTRELYQRQEAVFMDQVGELVPSEGWQRFLRKFLAWYNRKMYLNVDEAYKAEIYGISRFASADYDYIADAYPRLMYFHGAHDIGHALQDLALVGCTSFAAWGNQTADGELLIGRNFDFYAGDEFAENKIIAFVDPDRGHRFMSVTWGGFIGVVSGMNDQGLTVTINAGKSRVPLAARTPISLVAREILQHAATIEEAVTIARSREVFVSESILVGSARDGRAALIEVSPGDFGVYDLPGASQLICANHFQSITYADDKRNQWQIRESHSQYRYERMEELLGDHPGITPAAAVDILRDTRGLEDAQIGYGNEKALNQLLAHHGIVFQPEKLRVWVSSNPYQLGEFTAYDLDRVFEACRNGLPSGTLATTTANIGPDPFLETPEFRAYERYRQLRPQVLEAIEDGTHLDSGILQEFRHSNPMYWEVHYLTGEYYRQKGYYTVALQAYRLACELEITTAPERLQVEKRIRSLERKLR